MGYRSDVKVLIDIPSKKAEDLGKEIEKATLINGHSAFGEYQIDKKNNLLICEAKWVKWYEDFDEIKAFNDWIGNKQEEFENGLEGGIHFIRMGESLEDNEELIYGDPQHYLQIVRDTLNPDGCDFKRVNFEIKNNIEEEKGDIDL